MFLLIQSSFFNNFTLFILFISNFYKYYKTEMASVKSKITSMVAPKQ